MDARGGPGTRSCTPRARLSVPGGVGNAILGNSISANEELGIDLDDDGVTPNDPGDGDGGANLRQNFPENLAVSVDGRTITGTLNSLPARIYRVELFSNSGVSPCDPSGNGEGETFLASTDVTSEAGVCGWFRVRVLGCGVEQCSSLYRLLGGGSGWRARDS